MPQIFVILGPATIALFTNDEVGALGEKLIPSVEEGFGIAGKNDVAFTAVRAVVTENEAAVQIEIRYTAGEDEYGYGKPFDPTEEEQIGVAKFIKKASSAFFKAKGLPEYSLSVWCKPHYKGVFIDAYG